MAPACGTNMEGLPEYYAHAQAQLESRHPWWRRRAGADHFWWTTADGGGCDLNAAGSAVRRSIVVAHYLKVGCPRPEHAVAPPPCPTGRPC